MNCHLAETLTPSEWVVKFGSALDGCSTVLDVACGGGRHARWFADRGHLVTAVDRDSGAMEQLAGIPGITPVCTDLENADWPFESQRFSAVVVTNYLHRPLLPALVRAVAEDGLLIYETFALGNEKYGKPSNPAFLLRPGELLEAVRGRLRVMAYEDVFVQLPKPAMLQRICARRE